MRTRQQFLDTYAASHRHPLNQTIHLICVPIIYFASTGLLWSVPIGRLLQRLLGLPGEINLWINLATSALLPILFFYFLLGKKSLAIGVSWAAVSLAGVWAIATAGLPLAWICLTAWVAAWVLQFYGHHLEGAKPSFSDDLLFLLIGPLFVSEKFGRMLRGESKYRPDGRSI